MTRPEPKQVSLPGVADPTDLAGDNDTEVSAGALDELLVTDGARCVDELIPDPLFQTEKATKNDESVKNAIPGGDYRLKLEALEQPDLKQFHLVVVTGA